MFVFPSSGLSLFEFDIALRQVVYSLEFVEGDERRVVVQRIVGF